jgi:molybdate-binding protein
VPGYDTECTAHLLVASAIGSGLADAAVTTEPAALAYGLEFVPWQQEISELHIPRSLMGSLEVRGLLDVLGGRELPRQLAALAGYDAEPCGRILAA